MAKQLQVPEGFMNHIAELFAAVDEETFDRHVKGAQEYGALKFLGADTLEEALQELYDLINYARYTAVKVKLLQAFIAEQAADGSSSETTGGGAFVPTSQMMKGFGEKE